MIWLVNISIVFTAFFVMEGVAWFTHKYIMHGVGWFLHKDHHLKTTTDFLERNDFFFLIFALPGILGLWIGMENNYNFIFWVGLGITTYGAAYFIVHDVFIHQRFKILRNVDTLYFKAIRRAHKMHHKHISKEDGESFGMLWVASKYFKKTKNDLMQ